MFVESKNSRKKKIPVNVIINNPDTGKSQTETLTVSNNKPALLQLGGNILEGSTTVTISMAPKHLGDFIGIKPDSVRLFHGKKSFEYNFLKGLTVISAQFVLMVVIATLGSTFFSLPVNILFCLFIFFCGNITDFMRDISTVINLSASHDHNHDHGMSAVVKNPGTLAVLLNNFLTTPLITLTSPSKKFLSVWGICFYIVYFVCRHHS